VLLRLQGDGDYAGVQKLTQELGVIAAAAVDLDRLCSAHPVDVVFTQGKSVLGSSEGRRDGRGILKAARDLGGFSVRRVLPAADCRRRPVHLLRPHGPATFARARRDVRRTRTSSRDVTYLFTGEFMHATASHRELIRRAT